MPIPKTRQELHDLVETEFDRLTRELEAAGPDIGGAICTDEWTVRDLLTVRAWWTEQVLAWVESGRRGETPVTPAEGYSWKETPRLNAAIVAAHVEESFSAVRARLASGQARVLELIDQLSDEELLSAGVFAWAGKWPIARWISINTARQYDTARAYVRKCRMR